MKVYPFHHKQNKAISKWIYIKVGCRRFLIDPIRRFWKALPSLPPAPMTMIGGSLPLLIVIYITLLLDFFISLIYALIFSILNSRVWYLLLPAPLLSMLLTLVVGYDTFTRVTPLYYYLRLLIFTLFLITQALFIAFQDTLIPTQYSG